MRPNAIVAVFVALSACASPASADPAYVPSCNSFSYPSYIVLGGVDAHGVPDPVGTFVVIARDVGGNPLNMAYVTIDFTNCSDVVLDNAVSPGVTLDPTHRKASEYTDLGGEAYFTLTGHVGTRSPSTGAGSASISVGSVLCQHVTVVVLDQDGVDGVGPNDLYLAMSDIATHLLVGRSDYDENGTLTTNDAAVLLARLGAGGSTRSAPHFDGSTTVTPVVQDGGIALAWDDCRGATGVSSKTFACNTNSGTNTLVASFIAPSGLAGVTSGEAVLDFVGDIGSPLPSYWQMFNASTCNPARLTANALQNGTSACDVPWADVGIAGIAGVTYGFDGEPNRARMTFAFACGDGTVTPLSAGVEYRIANIRLAHTRTVGPGACAGCSAPVAIVLQSVLLTQGTWGSPARAGPDYFLQSPTGPNIAYWQGVPSGFNAPTPARNTTWGRLKTLYR